jgi:hypothetical protein
MPDFSEREDEAKKLAGEHPDIANKGIEEAGKVAGDRPAGSSTARSNKASRRPRGSWAPTSRAAKASRRRHVTGPRAPGSGGAIAGARGPPLGPLVLGPR